MLPEINLEDKNKFEKSLESWINESGITEDQKYKRKRASIINIIDVYKKKKTALDLSRSGLTSIPEAIGNLTSLQNLDLSFCNNLKTLPPLPEGLTTLNLNGCENLNTLPPLHKGLTTLNLNGCDKLSSDSIVKIVTLKEANKDNPHFRITLPQNISLRIFLDTIKETYKEYYSSNPNLSEKKFGVNDEKNYPFLFLLNRISENSIWRDKEKVLSWSILLVNEIKKKPEILEFLDHKSKHYLSRLNQPVAALMGINALMEITEQALKELPEKESLINIIKTGHLDPKSEEFERRTTELNNKIKELISCEDQPPRYQCSILNTMMRDPVKIKNKEKDFGRPYERTPILYERKAIEKWIDENGGSDPYRIVGILRKEDLEPQPELKIEINNFIKKYIDALIESIYLGDYSLEMVEKIKTFIGDDLKFVEKVNERVIERRTRPPFLEPKSTYANTLNPKRPGQSGKNFAVADLVFINVKQQEKPPSNSPEFHSVACIGSKVEKYLN